MSKEAKVSKKDFLPQLEQIKEKTEEISAIVEAFPDSYMKTTYTTTVVSLKKKNENFLTVKTGTKRGLTDEEKAVLAAMRAGKKVEISEVSTVEGDSTTANESVPSKKGRKQH